MSASTEQIRQVMSYVPRVARKYLGCGLDFDELVAAGNLGLVQAGLRYDVSRRVKLATYADWWIRKAILEALMTQSGPVRLPRYQHDRLRQLQDVRADWLTTRGQEPEVHDLVQVSGFRRDEAERLSGFWRHPVSLDHPAHGTDGSPYGELLADEDRTCPHRTVQTRDLALRVQCHLDSLEERERRVLKLRFGLEGDTPMTLRETGRHLGISRERVRQVEGRALVRLREML